MQNNNNNKLFK